MEPLIAAMVCFQTKGRTHDRRAQLAALGGLAVVLAPQTSHTRSIFPSGMLKDLPQEIPLDPIGCWILLDSVGFCWMLVALIAASRCQTKFAIGHLAMKKQQQGAQRHDLSAR
jgi:hypothetical protein